MRRGHDSNNARLFMRTHSNAEHEPRTVLSRGEWTSARRTLVHGPRCVVDFGACARGARRFVRAQRFAVAEQRREGESKSGPRWMRAPLKVCRGCLGSRSAVVSSGRRRPRTGSALLGHIHKTPFRSGATLLLRGPQHTRIVIRPGCDAAGHGWGGCETYAARAYVKISSSISRSHYTNLRK